MPRFGVIRRRYRTKRFRERDVPDGIDLLALAQILQRQGKPEHLRVAVACVSVNDAFVMSAWGKDQKVDDKVLMLADGNGDFTRAVGLEMDGTGYGMGKRSRRYALVAQDGVVKTLNVENPGAFEVSSAEAVLKAL